MSRFTTEQEKLMAKVELMRSEVSEVPLWNEDVPLLRGQLSELIVFAEALIKHARALRQSLRNPK